jgi:hypothetical protein
MDEKDLYKLRAEEFARSFESLRSLEWQVTFQLYAGYALIGAAYAYLISNDKIPHNPILSWMTIVAIIIMFVVVLYLSIRIQERQEYARAMQNAYLDKLHEIMKVPQLEKQLGTMTPKHPRWYAFLIQTILSVAFAMGLIAFVFLTM